VCAADFPGANLIVDIADIRAALVK